MINPAGGGIIVKMLFLKIFLNQISSTGFIDIKKAEVRDECRDTKGCKYKDLVHVFDKYELILKRRDGTSAAQRFFCTRFPYGGLPLPRQGRPKVVLDSLKLLGVSA